VAGASNVEWLLREAMDERALRISERADVDNDTWRATIERLQIGPGLRVFLSDVQAHQDVTVKARDDRTDQWMGSQVTIAGRADIDFLDGQRTYASADHAVLFRSPGRRAAYTVKAGARFHSAGYGIDVGRITNLEFDPSDPQRVIVTMQVQPNLNIREDSVASIDSHGFTGASFVDITGGTANSPILVAHEDQRYPVIHTKQSSFAQLQQSAPEVVAAKRSTIGPDPQPVSQQVRK
jgi:hypothetical protein